MEIRMKKRGQVTRKRKPVILISTEGKNKTEEIYFNNFKRNNNYSIIYSKGNYTDPINMVNALQSDIKKMELQKRYGDIAYCVFDTDVDISKQEQINKALSKLKNKNTIIELIPSNPCFEIWYKAHFSNSTKSYNNNEELIKDLRKLIPNYQKNIEVYSIIANKTEVAIDNAISMENYHKKSNIEIYDIKANPSTQVYKIVKKLINTEK